MAAAASHLMPSGDVDQNAHTAELVDAARHRVPAARCGRDVDRRVATAFDLGKNFCQRGRVPADTEYRCALAG
jgi:hypothetical protein